ncbi:MAG: hypothetical protein HC809_05640 [Gammaproteobacteria bacterium]|nr:hypothetical protein [Gammaproteobacteria bacterium]
METTTGVANPAATTATGPAFVAAGTEFRVDVDVLDAEGALTPNYGRELAAEGIRLASSSLELPIGGRNGSSGTGVLPNDTAFTTTATPGRFANNTVAFDEVGIVRLAASVADGDYLGSGPLSGPASGNVGRFRVATFDLVAGATVTPACATFTYMAQPALGVDYVIEARNALAGRVWNYDTTLLGGGAVAAIAPVAENADAGVDLGARLSGSVGNWVLGRVSVNTGAATFARGLGADGPFDGLQFGMRVDDPIDSITLSARDMLASASGDCVTAGTCDAVRIGLPTIVRYGRLMVKGALGPETQDLAVPLEAQYFDGSLFRPNTLDNCTPYAMPQVSLGGYLGNLAAGETTLIGPLASGTLVGGASSATQPLLLSAPDIPNDGSVDVTFDAPTFLEYDWNGTGNVDPLGKAQFGRYRGHDRIIFWRER